MKSNLKLITNASKYKKWPDPSQLLVLLVPLIDNAHFFFIILLLPFPLYNIFLYT